MGQTTGIEWTDATWNPVRGCSRVSEGCRNCYAERQAARFATPGIGVLGEEGKIPSERPAAYKAGPFYGFVTKVNGHPAWTGKVELVESHLLDPLKWKDPIRIFVNSMSDLFHENLPDEAIDQVFAVMALCPQHTFQILTKRPKRMLEYLRTIPLGGHDGSNDSRQYRVVLAIRNISDKFKSVQRDNLILPKWPLPNVWLGVSVENHSTAHERVPILRQVPAAVRFISQEPQIDYIEWGLVGGVSGIDLLIQGGESGPGARPFDLKWARTTRDECKAASVAYFLKQVGAKPIDTDPKRWQHRMRIGDGNQEYNRYIKVKLLDRKGGDISEWEEALRVREFPKFQTGAPR